MASCYTEPPILSAWIQEVDEGEKEPKSPQRSSSDESDESEPEPPPASVVRRKVSFADAFGLDLVSVKEFDNRVSAEERQREEFYLSCIFSVPASDDEMEFRLRQNKLELERIELLPGSTTICGTVRVLNLSYHKVVYVRTTLNDWRSYFDQLAEYIPGSSDGETDCFSFQITLMPLCPPEGLRVELCLCYETSTGTFWANNGGMNYVLFCHQRGGRALGEKEEEKEREAEENYQKGKKSCLKSVKKCSSAELKPNNMSSELSKPDTSRSAERKKGKTQHEVENRSKSVQEKSCKTLAERRNRWRVARLAYLQDNFSHRDTEVQQVQTSHAENPKGDLNVVLPIPQSSVPEMKNISSTSHKCKIRPDQQNPLPSVDWDGNITSPSPANSNTFEIISGMALAVLEEKTTGLSNDAWKEFLLCTAWPNPMQPSTTEYDVPSIEDKILSLWNRKDCAANHGSQKYFRAMESLESDPAELSPTLGPSHVNEVMAQTSSKPHTVQESEALWVQWRPEPPNSRHILSKKLSDDEYMLLPKLGETALLELNSKSGDRVLFEECTSCTALVDMKVKDDTHRVRDTLTLTGLGNKPFIECRECLERQCTDDILETLTKIDHIKEENENPSAFTPHWSKYSKAAMVVLENKLQENDDEPSHIKDGDSEISISSGGNVGCAKAKPHKQNECPDNGEDAAVCSELVEKGFSDSSRKQRGEILSVDNRDCKNGLKNVGQGIYFSLSMSDDYIDKELNNLCTGSHTSSPSGHPNCTAPLNQGKLIFPAPYRGFESEKIQGISGSP